MPMRLRDYTIADHLRLRPVIQAWKSWRYRVVDRRYMDRPAAEGNVEAVRSEIAGRDLLVTVAFQDTEALGLHLRLVRRYVRHDVHLVIDNSPDEAVRQRNRALCEAVGATYLRLPDNPWTARNDSRSHGIALNWTWTNIIRPGRPRAFGLLDQDLFPIAPDDPFASLADYAFYGELRPVLPRWFLWAGFSFFRFADVADKPLDFGLDWFVGLDTGGANWDVLYRHVNMHSLPQRPVVRIPAVDGLATDQAYFEERSGWIHEVGWPRDPDIRFAKRERLKAMLAPHLEEDQAAALKTSSSPA